MNANEMERIMVAPLSQSHTVHAEEGWARFEATQLLLTLDLAGKSLDQMGKTHENPKCAHDRSCISLDMFKSLRRASFFLKFWILKLQVEIGPYICRPQVTNMIWSGCVIWAWANVGFGANMFKCEIMKPMGIFELAMLGWRKNWFSMVSDGLIQFVSRISTDFPWQCLPV